MIRTGKVVAAENGRISVCFERPDMCQHCGACGEHHESLISFTADAQVGDTVQVDMPEQQLFRTAAFTYLTPIAALLLGLWLGQMLWQTEMGCALTGLVLLTISLVFVICYDRRIRKNPSRMPHITAIYKKEDIT